MRAFRAHRRLTSWIAVLTILLVTLAPSVSQALGFTKGASWIEVCSTQGSKWVQNDSGDSDSPTAAKQLLEHCPYCSIHAPMLGMPPSPAAVLLQREPRNGLPAAFLAAPRTLLAWVSAQPRAPPALS
jgi:hypothetical protein